MKVKILRQAGPFSKPYWQTFIYEQDMNVSVAAVLDSINYRDNVTDINGNPADLISWECSCLQGMCGGCAMVINGVPKLACDTFLKDLKGGELVLEPLRKFPVISDLVVDRGIIQENLKKSNIYIEEYDPEGEDHEHQYLAAKCLKCGLCLEVCPNYTTGKTFYGAVFANIIGWIVSGNKFPLSLCYFKYADIKWLGNRNLMLYLFWQMPEFRFGTSHGIMSWFNASHP